MSYVISVDVGVKNLAICIYDVETQKVINWHVGPLVEAGKIYLPHQNVTYVMEWLKNWKGYFDNALCVLVERQMRCNMRIIESLIQFAFYDKCHVINARSCKLHYGLSMRNYRLNKSKAVEWASEFIAQNPNAFETQCINMYNASQKKDDYADSLLLVMYYLDTFSRQVQ